MRKVFFSLSIALFLAKPALADNWANKIFGGEPNTPILQDFGTIARGAQLQATLKMKNIYKVPLTITDTHVSCGCVTVEVPQKVIQPQQTADLIIKMDGTRVNGHKSVNVNVTFGPQFVSTATIVVTANARQDVVLNPGQIEFGTVGRGQALSRTIEVECAGKPQWKVTEIKKSGAAPFDLRVETLPNRNVNGFDVIGYRLTATLKPNAPAGSFVENIDLDTNDQSQPRVSFAVTGNIDAPVVALPSNLQLANLRIGAMSRASVIVKASVPFRITGIQGNGSDVNLVASPTQSTPVHIVEVQVNPQAPGSLSREFILQTDMAGESVKVRVQGNVNP